MALCVTKTEIAWIPCQWVETVKGGNRSSAGGLWAWAADCRESGLISEFVRLCSKRHIVYRGGHTFWIGGLLLKWPSQIDRLGVRSDGSSSTLCCTSGMQLDIFIRVLVFVKQMFSWKKRECRLVHVATVPPTGRIKALQWHDIVLSILIRGVKQDGIDGAYFISWIVYSNIIYVDCPGDVCAASHLEKPRMIKESFFFNSKDSALF